MRASSSILYGVGGDRALKASAPRSHDPVDDWERRFSLEMLGMGAAADGAGRGILDEGESDMSRWIECV